jgi:hypothetical protein
VISRLRNLLSCDWGFRLSHWLLRRCILFIFLKDVARFSLLLTHAALLSIKDYNWC